MIPLLEAQISALRQASELLRQQLDDIREDRDHWRTISNRVTLPAPAANQSGDGGLFSREEPATANSEFILNSPPLANELTALANCILNSPIPSARRPWWRLAG